MILSFDLSVLSNPENRTLSAAPGKIGKFLPRQAADTLRLQEHAGKTVVRHVVGLPVAREADGTALFARRGEVQVACVAPARTLRAGLRFFFKLYSEMIHCHGDTPEITCPKYTMMC